MSTRVGIQNQQNYPIAAKIIQSDFYVDDLLTGANSKEEVCKIRREIVEILSEGGLELRKWSSNTPDVLKEIPRTSETAVLNLDKNSTIKTLGLQWDAQQDFLQFSIPARESCHRLTKRTILSDVCQVFDPLGLINPIIVKAKILMQRLWQLRIDWDEAVPMEIHTAWLEYRTELKHLNELRIPRHVFTHTNTIEIHGFCDASEVAYGAVVYVVSVDAAGNRTPSLLTSKSRVAPLKVITIPRLELCGAVLLAQLIENVKRALNVFVDNIYYWTDSTIVLAWINSTSRQWTTFVANRVSQIQQSTNSTQWRHVETSNNPADIVSRSATPSQLIATALWWQGPTWLTKSIKWWPSQHTKIVDPPERRYLVSNVCTKQHGLSTISYERFSSFTKLVRVMAYCLRFIQNCKSKQHERKTDTLTYKEISRAKTWLIKNVQADCFGKELKTLTANHVIERDSNILSMSPFLDDDGVIRVGGRLKNSNLSYWSKHQILLPAHHQLTKLIISHFHIKNLHPGLEGTLAAIRAEYWPIAARSTIRKILKNCIKCFRCNPSSTQQLMGNLPKPRVEPSRPFSNSGVDYCGPFLYKTSNRRNSPVHKAYAAIFICFATKAVHCEVVTSLTAEAFIATLKRFIARRGKVLHMFSDNGTNFVGAKNELTELRSQLLNQLTENKIMEAFAEEGMTWHFIPANSPHFGGLWESAVKSAKRHLRRIAGNASLTLEELSTLFAQVEAILNSRPITPMSNDPNDLTFLTPAHFLIGDCLTSLPEPRLSDLPTNRLSRWQQIERLRQHFWKRWHAEYLCQLQQRKKWKTNLGPQLTIGQLVLIRDDNLPPLKWSLGRVTLLHSGTDGIVRAATVKTSSGEIRRAAAKLCILPHEP